MAPCGTSAVCNRTIADVPAHCVIHKWVVLLAEMVGNCTLPFSADSLGHQEGKFPLCIVQQVWQHVCVVTIAVQALENAIAEGDIGALRAYLEQLQEALRGEAGTGSVGDTSAVGAHPRHRHILVGLVELQLCVGGRKASCLIGIFCTSAGLQV